MHAAIAASLLGRTLVPRGASALLLGCGDTREQSGETFDYLILEEVLARCQDVWSLLRDLRRLCHGGTQVLLRCPRWLRCADLCTFLKLSHFAVLRCGTWPSPHVWARPEVLPAPRQYSCSVIVPCRNERGNIADIVTRTPLLGRDTELLFVEGQSEDGTAERIQEEVALARRKDLRLRLLRQGLGRGKGHAVHQGFAAAEGELLLVLDADLTVAPEELPKFYQALAEDRGRLAYGSRLVYPMEERAMRTLNRWGNRFFAGALSHLVGQRVTDTLCGTKVLLRADYQSILEARGALAGLDPFGDFDLLLGAARAGLPLIEVPVRYRARRYGQSQIRRFADGLRLLRLTVQAYAQGRGRAQQDSAGGRVS